MRRRTSAILASALIALAATREASACKLHGAHTSTWGCDSPARFERRYDTGAARIAITTQDGAATLLINDDVVALQLSDHTFKRIDRRFREEEQEDDNAFGAAIKSAVFASVRSMLDHSAAIRIREIRTVRYRDGRLEIVTTDGRHVLEDARIDEEEDTLGSFSEHDALAFVREFDRVKGQAR